MPEAHGIVSPQRRRGDVTVVAGLVNDVAFKLYRELAARDNLVFSPLGVYGVLRMLYEGARGATREALLQVLRRESDAPDPEPPLRPLLDELKELDAGDASRGWRVPLLQPQLDDELKALTQLSEADVRALQASAALDALLVHEFRRATAEDLRLDLRIASALWIQTGYAVDPGFTAALRAMMEADVTNLDFVRDPAGSCDAINAWVTERTRGRIHTMLARLPPLTRVIVGNALYFKARWAEEFGAPEPGHFYRLDGTPVPAQMMTCHFFGLNYIRGSDCWAVELPYRATSASMVLMLPDEPGDRAFSALERDQGSRWTEALDRPATAADAVLTIPQFKVEAVPWQDNVR